MKNDSEQQKSGGKRLAGGGPADQGKKPAKAPKPGGKKRRISRQQIGLIAAVVLLALALLGVLAWRSLFVRPDIPQKDSTQQPGASGTGSETGGPEEIDWGEGVRPRGGDGERKSADYWTVLILGRDTGGGGNTDTMLLASYDVTNQKATVMSIPRDTMVNIPYDIKRINAVYNYYGQGEKGIQHLYKEISQLVGFEPDYQVIVEWEAVGKIVDAMGGVYFDVPRNMNYDDPFQDLHIHQTEGYRLLTGDDAMQVLRYRYDTGKKRGYPDGDIGRIATQQGLLKAMVQQLLQLKNIGKVQELAKVFQECVETDLSFQNILWFAKSAYMGGLKVEDVNFVTMPGNYVATAWSRTYGNQQSYVTPYPNELLKLVNEELSPFKEVFTLRDLDIMSVNADGSLRSSTGYVEDKKAALPPPKPEPEPEEEEPAVDGNGNPIDPETGLPLDPETGEPIVTDPAVGEGGEPGGTGSGGGTGGGTAVVPPVTDPGTAADPDPWRDPNETDPGTGAEDPGWTDPGALEPVPELPAVQEPPAVPEVPEIPAVPETPAEDPGFAIIGAPPEE